MKKINIKTYLKKKKQRVSVSGISPRFDWLFIVVTFVTLLICGMVFAGFLYAKVNSGVLFEATEDASLKTELDQKKSKIKEKAEWLRERNFDESVLN